MSNKREFYLRFSFKTAFPFLKATKCFQRIENNIYLRFTHFSGCTQMSKIKLSSKHPV